MVEKKSEETEEIIWFNQANPNDTMSWTRVEKKVNIIENLEDECEHSAVTLF